MWLLRSLKVAALLTPVMPSRLGYFICRILGLGYCLINYRARRNIDYNLQHVVPAAPRSRRLVLAVRACVTVATNFYDLLRMRSVDRESILDLVDITGLENIECAHAQGQGVIILSAHVGNFSVMARLPAALGYHAALIAEEVEPPSLFTYKARLRSAMGIEVIPPGPSTVRRVTRLLRNNGMLLVAGDRDVTGTGIPVRFFGTQTPLPPGPIILAMRTGAALVPAFTTRTGDRRSNVRIGPEVSLVRSGNWPADLQTNLVMMAAQLEPMIAADPGQWAVLQRVWPPTSRFGHSDGLGSADPYLPRSEPEAGTRDSERRVRQVTRAR